MTGLAYNLLKSPKDLKPHPLNIEIYGMEVADLDLVESIRMKGILEPIVIRDDDVILSGHRRWMAAKDLKLNKVPCRSMSFSDPMDEEEALIEFNRQRIKNFSQTMKESDHLLEIERERNKKLQATSTGGSNPQLVAMLPQADRGKSRDVVAEKVGMKPRTFDKAREVWEKAKVGNETAKEFLKKLDSKSDNKIDGKTVTINQAFNEIKKQESLEERRADLIAKAEIVKQLPDTIQVIHGNFLTDYVKIPAGSIDCILTDPPYVNQWLGNYEAFALAAEHVLKPGGFLITYVGHIHMDKILDQMCKYLDYYWIACLKHSGTTKAVHSRSVQCGMKPILIFQKSPMTDPKRYFNDVIIGTGREKDAHEWQQGEEELRQLIEPFTDPGDTILDPFMGSGTVISMAKKMDRLAIGFDIDGDNVAIVRARVAA